MTNRILLQDRQSGMFFKGGRRWTSESTEAMDFRYVLIALDFAFSLKTLQLDIVMSFDDPRHNFRLNLSSCAESGAPTNGNAEKLHA